MSFHFRLISAHSFSIEILRKRETKQLEIIWVPEPWMQDPKGFLIIFSVSQSFDQEDFAEEELQEGSSPIGCNSLMCRGVSCLARVEILTENTISARSATPV